MTPRALAAGLAVAATVLIGAMPAAAAPPRGWAEVPPGVSALLRDGGRVRVPVVCTPRSTECRGRVTVRSGGRSWSRPYRLGPAAGRWVRVRTGRPLRRAVVEIRVAGRRTDRKALPVRRRLASGCPRRPWAEVLDRRSGVAVFKLFSPVAGRPDVDATRQTVLACRREDRQEVRLRTAKQVPFGIFESIPEAWAGAESIALEFTSQFHRSEASIFVTLHDSRTGRLLGTALVGTIDPHNAFPPARDVLDVAFSRGGDAVYAAQVGGDVRVAVLGRDGEHRVLEEGPGVDPRSARRQARSL